MTDARDMTRGAPVRGLLWFSVPLLAGNFAQQIYAIFDGVMVGRHSMQGEAALVAVAACGSVLNLLMVPVLAIAMSAGVIVSQLFGAKDGERLLSAASTAVTAVVSLCALLTGAGIALAPALLSWINTPQAALPIATQYFRVLMVGLTVNGLYGILAGALRGMGDSVWPLLILLGTTVLNAVLDACFLIGARWGVVGTAWAGVLASGVAALLCAGRLLRMRGIADFRGIRLAVDPSLLRKMVQMAVPAGLTQGALSVGLLMLQSLTNRMGPEAVVATMAVFRVDGFAMLHCFAFGHATATFVGQNIGARRLDRVQLGMNSALRLTLWTSAFMALLLMLVGSQAVSWFTDSAKAQALGVRAFQILAISYLALGAGQVFGGVIRGAGDMVPNMWIMIGTHFLIRVPLAYALASRLSSPEWPNGSPEALMWALLAARVVTAVASWAWCARAGVPAPIGRHFSPE